MEELIQKFWNQYGRDAIKINLSKISPDLINPDSITAHYLAIKTKIEDGSINSLESFRRYFFDNPNSNVGESSLKLIKCDKKILYGILIIETDELLAKHKSINAFFFQNTSFNGAENNILAKQFQEADDFIQAKVKEYELLIENGSIYSFDQLYKLLKLMVITAIYIKIGEDSVTEEEMKN